MKPDPRFLNQPTHFWANVRTISQHVGYTARGTGQILVPDLAVIVKALGELDPVMMDGDRFIDGRHRVEAYARAGRTTIPTVDIGRVLRTDWDAWMNG